MTKQDIARIYGMYIGCEVIHPNNGKPDTFRGLKILFDDFIRINFDEDTNWYDHKDCRLHLKSLEDISNEDIDKLWLEVGLNPNYGNNEAYDNENRKEAVLSIFNVRLLTDLFSPDMIIAIADHLRKEGFAIDYNGHNLFEPLPDGTIIAVRKVK